MRRAASLALEGLGLAMTITLASVQVARAQSRRRAPPAPASATAACPARTAADTGSIEGSLYFPDRGPLPAMSVVAIAQSPANGCAYYVTTTRGTDRYALTGLPAGDYLLVAYATDASGRARAGGFTDSVTCMAGCGVHGGCCRGAHHVSHVIHLHGERIRHISIADWEASLPAKPAGVPQESSHRTLTPPSSLRRGRGVLPSSTHPASFPSSA